MSAVRKQYHHNGLAGCVEQWTCRATRTRCGLYHAAQAGMEDDPADGIWATVCEEHSTLVLHMQLKLARTFRDPRAWCDDCRAKEDPERYKLECPVLNTAESPASKEAP